MPQTGYIEAGSMIGMGNKAPFWLYSNHYGQLSAQKTNFYFKAGFLKDVDSIKKFDYSYGVDLMNHYDNRYQLYFHQAFIKVKFRFAQLTIGKIEEHFGEQDNELSSGNLLWSGNARPIPQISFCMPEYIPLLKGFVDVKGYISHGWMNDNRYVKNYYLHHKNAYIRFGSKFPVSFSYGLEHYTQWGGNSPELGQLPSGWSDYIKVFFAKSGGSGAPWMEEENRLGNHLGSKNFTLDIKTKPAIIKLYWQYMFEDASKDHWENISDGLWGISINFKESKVIQKIVFEYINTTNQSGPKHLWNDTIKLGGEDNYFNNIVYQNGWKYNDRIIGTPFISSITADTIGTTNNCIRAFHLGISGSITTNTHFRTLLSYARNYGQIISNIGSYIYTNNPPKENISLLLECTTVLNKKTQINFSSAFDLGSQHGNNIGFLISIRRNFNF